MASSVKRADPPCTMLIDSTSMEPPQIMALKKALEEGKDAQKIEVLKKIIIMMINGESFPQLLMPIILNVSTSKDRTIKKLLLLFWEIADKKSADGKLLSEMYLVCNALMQDLTHPNEYIRGSTLRFMCKLKEPELLESLVESIKGNLTNNNSYVRKNAVLAVYSIYKDFEYLIPDAPQIIYNFLLSEAESSCRRNAFLMLFNCNNDLALEYLQLQMDNVSSLGEMLQLIILEMIRKMNKTANSQKRMVHMRIIFTLLTSSVKSHAVQYEAAITLLSLSRAPSAVKASAHALVGILQHSSDNNVKLIVLDRLADIQSKFPKVLQDLVMDILRALQSPNLDIVKKTLEIATELLNPHNIAEVITLMKKEIIRSQSSELEKGAEYRSILIKAIHTCAVKFPDIASDVVHQLLDFIGDSNVQSAIDVVSFMREAIHRYPQMRSPLIKKLSNSFQNIQASPVFRSVLWILGEFSDSIEDIKLAFKTIVTNVVVVEPESEDDVPSYNILQSLIYEHTDYFLISAVATSLTKLLLRGKRMNIENWNTLSVRVLIVLVNLLKLTTRVSETYPYAREVVAPDSHDWITNCIRSITHPSPLFESTLLDKCGESFTKTLDHVNSANGQGSYTPIRSEREMVNQQGSMHVDDLIRFRLLKDKASEFGGEDDEEDVVAVQGWNERKKEDDLTSRLNRIVQLTGLSDSIYAEANITLHQYDIILDVNILNQTSDTLHNLSLELSTLGDLKISERTQNFNVGPFGKLSIKTNIKISSTNTGTIFGSIVYDLSGPNGPTNHSVVLNEIHIDIIDYIIGDTIDDDAFRSKWQEYIWESKVAVHSDMKLEEFVNFIVKSTNMNCLAPQSVSMMSSCGFVSTNLCAKSKFGEQALANISVHTSETGKISGFVRIRAKTRGIAYNLGEKISQWLK